MQAGSELSGGLGRVFGAKSRMNKMGEPTNGKRTH